MKRVLLTGGTGFIGRNAIAPLLAAGYEVHAVASRRAGPVMDGVHWHRADLLDKNEVAGLMSRIRPSHLLHFAWYAEPGKFWGSTENFRWLEASIGLMRHFRESGGERVVMAGTCAEYDWDHGYCTETVTPCRPSTPYGVCKNALQEVLHSYSTETGLSSAWGRVFFLYGPDEAASRFVPSVITSLLRGDNANCSHGNQLRDFMHVEDVGSAFVALLDSPVTGAVNISSGRPLSLRELALTIADSLGASPERICFGAIPAQENDPPLLAGNSRRLTEEVGWHPRHDIRSGIEQTTHWWKSQPNLGSCT